MVEITLKIEGMSCGMCEAHVNDAVRAAFKVKKVSSSFKKGETTVVCENELDESALRDAIEKGGYKVVSVQTAPYVKKGLFHR